jgi:8-oxo-dGTP diphosphatase
MPSQQKNPPQRQRIAAYAVLVRRVDGVDEVLLTRMSSNTRIKGRWTLPGGGIDHGEDPRIAVVREVYEETGLELTPGRLVGVTSRHFTGHAPNGRLEDFHAIRLLYDGSVTGGEPHVTEVGGSTDAAAWHPVEGLADLNLVSLVAEGLAAVGVMVPGG